MASEAETEPERGKRRRQRTLFNDVAELYAKTRPGYPRDLIEFVVATAKVRVGAAVLDVGCGPGQLTGPFARRGFTMTAIDIAPSMIAAARRRLADTDVRFHVGPFEDFGAPDASFDLIVSGAAFHWVDPEVRFAKAARLLRPGGWLALLGYDEVYADPFGQVLRAMWNSRANGAGAWVRRPADAEAFVASEVFGPPVGWASREQVTRSAESVIGVENTRATTLSWSAAVREQFNAELRGQLRSREEVPLTVESTVTMARVLTG